MKSRIIQNPNPIMFGELGGISLSPNTLLNNCDIFNFDLGVLTSLSTYLCYVIVVASVQLNKWPKI